MFPNRGPGAGHSCVNFTSTVLPYIYRGHNPQGTTLLSHFHTIANRLFLGTGKTLRQHQHRHEVPKDPMGVKGKTPIAFGGGEVLGTGFVPWILMEVIIYGVQL